MKVVNIISDTNIGGAGKCLVNYANNCNDKDINLYIVVPKNSLLIPYFKNRDKVIEIDGLYDKSMDISVIFKLVKILKEIKPDIVHTHAAVIARLVARFSLKCKIIYTKHCYYELKKYEGWFIARLLCKIMDSFFADKIIIVTEALRKNMIDRGSISNKLELIVNSGVMVKNISLDRKKKIRKKYGIKEKDFIVAIIARLVSDKGHETFIKVASEFKKKGIKDIKFLIVGVGELSDKLKLLVSELELDDMVIFTGFVKDTSDILNITSLQVNCSLGTETSSLSILDGYSLGIPCVASNYGGNPYIVKDNITGYVVDVFDVDGYYKKIKMIKDNRILYDKLCLSTKNEYNNKYTINRYVEEINKVYYDVMNG